MTLNMLPLSYCTNVHPGLTVAEVESGLREYTSRLRKQFGPLAAGLWLARPVVGELLESASSIETLKSVLKEFDLSCYTLNTFPYGNFHDERVKENVYLPDWTSTERLAYTIDCAKVLAELMPDGIDGSMSTSPLGFKPFHEGRTSQFVAECIPQVIEAARQLDQLYQATGRRIRLAIEPEPFCVLETTPETIDFFGQLRSDANEVHALDLVNEYIGVCYDVCHQSVEFEDVAASIDSLRDNQIRIVKVHITCAIRIESPNESPGVLAELAQYVEPRYLHQSMARCPDGTIARLVDLTKEMTDSPSGGFEDSDEWRVHYHVPVNAESLGQLQTTRDDLKIALRAVADLDYAPHLEVETYTWQVLPDGQQVSLIDGFLAELAATRKLLDEIG